METNFNFKSQIATSREQSERLLALGLKRETADMCWQTTTLNGEPITYPSQDVWLSGSIITNNHFPAWSLHRLIEMMPFDVIPEGGFDNCFTLIKNYPKGYSVEYDGFSYYHKENIYDTLIDGIEHLIKEGYFNKEYLV